MTDPKERKLPFNPVLSDDRESIEFDLNVTFHGGRLDTSASHNSNKKIISFTEKAFNEFLGIIVKVLDFDSEEKFELFWKKCEDHRGVRGVYYYGFSWMNGTCLEIEDGKNLGEVINIILKVWSEENELEDSGTFEWINDPAKSPMKFVWINEFFQGLASRLSNKTKASKEYEGIGKDYWDEIRGQLAIQIDEHIARYASLPGSKIIVNEGSICNDPNLILGLLLSSELYLHFEDCVFTGQEEMVYHRNIRKICGGEKCIYYGMEIIWKSYTKKKWSPEESWVGYPLTFFDYNENPDRELLDSRAWIIREKCFCGKSRLTANKTIMEKNTHMTMGVYETSEDAIITGIKELDSTDSVEDLIESGDLTELITTIFDSNDPKKLLELNDNRTDIDLDNVSPPVSVRELPFTGKSLEFIAKSIEDNIEFFRGYLRIDPNQEISIEERKIQENESKRLRVIKHRLGNKLIEIGNFLEWWPDIGPIMRSHFTRRTYGKDGAEKSEFTLPLQIFGNGLKNAFDWDFEYSDEVGKFIWEE